MESTQAKPPTVASPIGTAAAAIIRVLPGTGHHFHFVPFPREQLARLPDLERVCREEKSSWREARGPDGKRLPWLRYRLCSRTPIAGGERLHGLLVAVETNLGRSQRGWIYASEEAISKEQAVQYATGPERAPTPYAFADETELPADGIQRLTFAAEDPTLRLPQGAAVPQVPLVIIWQKPMAETMDVDLIIDFGNTRTAALLLEHNISAKGNLNAICYPVRFGARGEEFTPFAGNDDPAAIVESWFVLQEPLFANLEPSDKRTVAENVSLVEDLRWESAGKALWPFAQPKSCVVGRTLRVPQMFTEFSPAILGVEAGNILTQLPLETGGNFFLSSPKRYLWDQDMLGQLGVTGMGYWTMNLNRWHPGFDHYANRHIVYELGGTVCRFLDENGKDWSLDTGAAPNERAEIAARPSTSPKAPAYPRSDTLTWAALSVIEAAYRQMTSATWREQLGTGYVPRRLRNITVTFPPGWTGQELDAYRRKWQKAIDIFTLAHLPDRRPVSNGGDRPDLTMDIDEAVASQLPIVFGEIQRFSAGGENWIELVGRGKAGDARVRILNIDIGGGTTDIAIIEYRNELAGLGVKLSAELLYRDSSTVAGDAMVRRIIESVLLPSLGESLASDELRTRFETLMSSQKQAQRPVWNKITRLVFMPIVRWWLQALATGKDTAMPSAPAQMTSSDGPIVDSSTVEAFNGLCRAAGLGNLLPYEAPLAYDRPTLHRCARETFGESFDSLAKVLESFDCDLVLVSGKPSELPPVKELLEESLPILAQRIMFARNAEVGDWYPLSADGKVHDAKTVTVAGAALYQAIQNGLVPGWKMERRVSPYLLQRNYWGLLPVGGRRNFSRLLLTPAEQFKSCELMIPARLGRKMLPSEVRPEPVYELRWRDRSRKDNAIVQVEFGRVLPPEQNQPEHLEIVSASGLVDDKGVTKDDLELRLCTLEAEDYWIDAGKFEVNWPEPAARN